MVWGTHNGRSFRSFPGELSRLLNSNLRSSILIRNIVFWASSLNNIFFHWIFNLDDICVACGDLGTRGYEGESVQRGSSWIKSVYGISWVGFQKWSFLGTVWKRMNTVFCRKTMYCVSPAIASFVDISGSLSNPQLYTFLFCLMFRVFASVAYYLVVEVSLLENPCLGVFDNGDSDGVS